MKKNYMRTWKLCLALCLLSMGVCTSCTQPGSPGAAVIFPQEKQPGKAKLTTEQNGEFTLSNDLLTAKFIAQDGKLMFAGAPELGLQPGTEIFKIRLGDGTEVLASNMKLEGVQAIPLKGDKNAVKGAKKFDGHAIEDNFAYGDLAIVWRAILRDG